MSDIKRIDPRRPFRITPAGLKRIVLGAVDHGEPTATVTGASGPQVRGKPLRLQQSAERWFMALVHSDRGRLDGYARQAIAAAAILAPRNTGVVAVVLGDLHEDLAEAGADQVVVLPEFNFEKYQPEREVAAARVLIEAYKVQHVFIPDSMQGDGDLGRRLIAAHHDSSATHAIEIATDHVAIPWSGGEALARRALPRFLLLDAGIVEATLPFVGRGERVRSEDVPAFSDVGDVVRDLGLEEQDAQNVALEEADFIVGAGNGVRNVPTLESLARTLGATVGASRVAVDEGKFPRDKQIGATGKTVSASAYVAVGISGAVQHLQGIKDCRHVIAINRDAGAPIVKRADLTLVGDAEDLMQAIVTRFEQARAQREMPGSS